jgi:putative transposase
VNSDSIALSNSQQVELSRIAQSRSLPAGYVFRVRLILMLAEGAPFSTIKNRLGTTAPTISRWKQRFLASGSTAWIPAILDNRLGY